MDLLADLRLDGFILFPGVPNTTAVTQETDQNYGPFKTQCCKNLDALVDERLKQGKSTSLAPWQVGLIVYGGTDLETGLIVELVFDAGFSREARKKAWDKVGAAPITRAALENKKPPNTKPSSSLSSRRMTLPSIHCRQMDTRAWCYRQQLLRILKQRWRPKR